jgi:DNA-binding PadR family transcriptional regulator
VKSVSARWVVLGLLLEQPDYCYGVSQRYDQVCGQFGRALPSLSGSSIYKVIYALQGDDLVEELRQEWIGPRRTQRRVVFKATADGARAYRAWVVEQFQGDPARMDMMRRFAGASDSATLMMLDVYAAECLAQLAKLPKLRERSREAVARMPRAERMEHHLNQHRRVTLDAELAWTAMVREDIQAALEHAGHQEAEGYDDDLSALA